MKISVIIPVLNQEKRIVPCLETLSKQTKKAHEIILVNDGSTDKTGEMIERFISEHPRLSIFHLTQKQSGPGIARNLGAQKAAGDILVFVDSDMTFDTRFLEKLTVPIIEKKSKGTFTKNEYVRNWDNILARCWNFNENIFENRRIPRDYPDTAPVFRALLKKEFDRVNGFSAIGYTDDWTLSEKLGYQATVAQGAICYHDNPETLHAVFKKAFWIGKNHFISGSIIRSVLNLFRFSFPVSLFIGIVKGGRAKVSMFLPFKLVYDFGITVGIWTRLIKSTKY